MRYSNLVKQFYIISKSKWLLHLFKGKLFSIASFEVVTNLSKIIPDLKYIIDVGANSGQFTKVISDFYPEAQIDVFEPLPNLYPKIKRLFNKNKQINTHNCALGNEVGTIKFNQNSYGHISSVLDINSNNIHYPKHVNDLNKIEVEIKTLDLFLGSRKINGPSLLKLDVQGYELEVLKGATNTLKKLNYVVFEANLEQLYENQPSFTEVNTYLNTQNFEMVGMLDFNLGANNKYIEIDLLYKNINI